MLLNILRYDDGTIELWGTGVQHDPKRTFGRLGDAYQIAHSVYNATFKYEYRAIDSTVEVWQS